MVGRTMLEIYVIGGAFFNDLTKRITHAIIIIKEADLH